MAVETLTGGGKLAAVLDDISKKASGELSVGFMEGATYPDGESVAVVAFKNEFGVPENHQPPRPFFRRMVAKESSSWPGKLSRQLKGTGYDGKRALALLGEDISGALRESIIELTHPPLAEKTIQLRLERSKAKPTEGMRNTEGVPIMGIEKPLIDSGHMLNSVTYKVEG